MGYTHTSHRRHSSKVCYTVYSVQRCATQSILFKGVLHSLFHCACCVYLFQCRFWDIILSCLTQYIHSLTPEQLLHTNTWLWLFIVAIIYCKCYNHVPRSFQNECVQIKLYIVLWVAQVIDCMRLIMIYCLHGSGRRVCCANVTYTGGCVNYTYSGSHTMHICHNISTVHWLEWPPPKVLYQPNC